MSIEQESVARADVETGVARNWGPSWFRRLLVALAAAYLALVVLGILLSGVLHRWVPGPILFVSQVAGLFASSKINDTEFRAEGWDCAAQTFREIDVRPLFPILADDKESRFSRALYFFRGHREVLSALDDYVTEGHNRGAALSASEGRIGGVRFSSVRPPIPPAGGPVRRYRRIPLDEYPPEQRKALYASSTARRGARCGQNR